MVLTPPSYELRSQVALGRLQLDALWFRTIEDSLFPDVLIEIKVSPPPGLVLTVQLMRIIETSVAKNASYSKRTGRRSRPWIIVAASSEGLVELAHELERRNGVFISVVDPESIDDLQIPRLLPHAEWGTYPGDIGAIRSRGP